MMLKWKFSKGSSGTTQLIFKEKKSSEVCHCFKAWTETGKHALPTNQHLFLFVTQALLAAQDPFWRI